MRSLGELEQEFPDFRFRSFPNAKFEFLRWQAGRIEFERRTVPSNIATGYVEVELKVKLFRLVAFSDNAADLAQQLDKLDGGRPHYATAKAKPVLDSPVAESVSAQPVAQDDPAGHVEALSLQPPSGGYVELMM